MKSLYYSVASVLLMLFITGKAQYSFEIIRDIPGSDGVVASIESEDYYYILGARPHDSAFMGLAHSVIKLNKIGFIETEKISYKQDTLFNYSRGFIKKNGNLLIFGTLTDSNTFTIYDKNITYVCEMSPDLDIVWEKMYPIPFPPYHSNHRIFGYMITPDDHIIIHGTIDTSLYGFNEFLYFSKFDMNGNQISFVPHLNFKDTAIGGSTAVFKPDSSGFFMIGNLTYGNVGFVRNWIELDLDMNILAHGLIENGLPTSGISSTARRLSNGNIVFANTDYNLQEIQNLKMWIFDQSFNETYGSMYYTDQAVRVLDQQGMDFYTEDNIWVATFIPIPETFPGTEEFYVYLFDADIQIKGYNVFGGENRFWLFYILATSDGGCIITGVVPEYEGSNDINGYILKLMPDDMLTVTGETSIRITEKVMVFPNPFSGEIKISNRSSRLKFSLFNVTGNKVLHHELKEASDISIPSYHLPKGFYFFTIRDEIQIIQSGKLIKY